MKFKSENSVSYIEDDILTIAFADSKRPDPEKYLILQRETDYSDLYYYEFCSQYFSNEGGFKKVIITENSLEIFFNNNQNIFKAGVEKIEIEFGKNEQIKNSLISIFSYSDTELCVVH